MGTNPRLGIRQSRRTEIFRLAERKLRAHSVLSAKIKTWKSYRGEPSDLVDITVNMCPAIRLSWGTGGATSRDNISQKAMFTLRIEIFTAGTCIDDSADLWAQIEEALYPTDPEEQAQMRTAFQAVGTIRSDWKVTEPSVATAQLNDGALQVATGSLMIPYSIQGP